MTKFFTGKGDKGKSHIGDKKLSKDSSLMEFLGTLDELNSWLGFCRVNIPKFKNDKIGIKNTIESLQECLFIAQAEVASLGLGHEPNKSITEDKVKEMENIINKIDELLPDIDHFIVAGESELEARIEIARSVSRRLERRALTYSKESDISDNLLQFLNRFSSILYALARYANYLQDKKEKQPNYK